MDKFEHFSSMEGTTLPSPSCASTSLTLIVDAMKNFCFAARFLKCENRGNLLFSSFLKYLWKNKQLQISESFFESPSYAGSKSFLSSLIIPNQFHRPHGHTYSVLVLKYEITLCSSLLSVD